MSGCRRMVMQNFGVALGIALMAVTVPAGSGQDRDLPDLAGVAAADSAFAQAITRGDRAGVKKFLDADFTWTSADGATHPRAEVLRQLPKAAIASERDAESPVF